jgi:uncharacterized protein (DUF433 family)
VLDLLGAGVDREEILEEYPDLENERISPQPGICPCKFMRQET